MQTGLLVTQVYIEKMVNRNIEIGFQSAVFHLCQRVLVILLQNAGGFYLGLGKTDKALLKKFSFLQYYVQSLSSPRCYKGAKITRLLSFSN